jgi:GTPase SAR1 family protein
MLQVPVSFGATWDAKCDELVAQGTAWEDSQAFRVCMTLWTQELADGLAFTNIPLEVVQRGATSTQSLIDQLKTSTEIVLRRKICLVGSSCAGKTSLVKCITSKEAITSEEPNLVPHDERTIGIDHFPYRFEQFIRSRDETKIHEVTFWDFAGQDVYQVAHSLFFSPRTLYLVCVNLEAFAIAYMQAVIFADVEIQEEKLLGEFVEDTVMRWIRMIVARQPDAEIVFIATKEDLLRDNKVTEQLLKETLMTKLKQVEATAQLMKSQVKTESEPSETTSTSLKTILNKVGATVQWVKDQLKTDHQITRDSSTGVCDREPTPAPTVMFASCTALASVRAAKVRIETLIGQSERSFAMPDTYTQALEAIVDIREDADVANIATRLHHVFAPVVTLPAKLEVKPALCRTILQTLHDLGDVLWYEDLDVELFQNTVILDPLLLIDFIRQVITHKHTGVTISHLDLKSKPFWMGLNQEQMKAMKQVLQKFHLVYPDDEHGIMHWDSDLIVPAFWQTRTPASWKFLGDILRVNTTRSREGEAVRVHWEYNFEFGLPSPLFDQLVVASVSPYFKFDAGPDWIVYEEKEVAACRIMVGRDLPSLHQTIIVEAVVAEAATKKQVDKLWKNFRHLCGAFVRVLREYPGLAGVSSFAWDDEDTKINLKRLLQSPYDNDTATWMPPPETWAWFQQRATEPGKL